MERKVTGLNIDVEKSQLWHTPLPLFQHLRSDKNNDTTKNTRTNFCVKAQPRRKEVKVTSSGESVPIQLPATMPRHVSGFRERHIVEMVEDGTITVPIEVRSNETQTDEFPESSPENELPTVTPTLPEPVVLKLVTVDRATSPINHPREKQLFEELEQITGHIIIQKFITRSEEEFQQLIKIRFPGMKVRETTITHSSASFLPTHHEHYSPSVPTGKGTEEEAKIGQGRNPAESSFKLPQTILEEESLKSELEEVRETKQFQSVLEESARGEERTHDTTTAEDHNVNTWKKEESPGSLEVTASDLEDEIVMVQEESDTEDEPSLIEIKEVVMTPFSASNSQTIPSKWIEIGADEIPFPEDEIRLLEKEIVQNESKEDDGGDGDADQFGKSVYNSDSVSDTKSDPMTGKNVDKDKVESESEREEDDDDGTLSPVYNSVIQSMNYVVIEEDEEPNVESTSKEPPAVVTSLDPTSKSVATQTDARSSVRRSRAGRNWDSAQSSSNSSTPSLLDLQLRVQKLDVRLRVGARAGKRKGNQNSATFMENFQVGTEHLDILEVHGTKIKLQEDSSKII